ncbi:hypothetical protein [Micromonospora sp. NPDC047730]|uniref:hypothetical protein n=1 Tax=Micromonospora sp. NPDC047730 TaxID=3364253 RepID=UPI00371C8029
MPEKTYGEHSAEMREKYGEGLTEAQHNKVYAFAYERGHAFGYSEVESHYEEVAELARGLLGID